MSQGGGARGSRGAADALSFLEITPLTLSSKASPSLNTLSLPEYHLTPHNNPTSQA